MSPITRENSKETIHKGRWYLLLQVHKMSEPVLILFGFIWLVLLIIDLIQGLSKQLLFFSNFIWGIFIIDFILKLIIAPKKLIFLKKNILTMISLILPALRILKITMFFRFFRVMKATRSLRLARIITSLNRGIRTLNLTLRRRAFGYVMLLTITILFTGAGGMYAFENDAGIKNYWHSLWWTAMIITTMGSEYWPQSPEGKFLCLLLAVYGFAIFGYITATIASFFVGRDAESDKGEIAGAKQVKHLEKQIQNLNQLLEELKKKN